MYRKAMIESVSKRAFRGSSGTYNVRALEQARSKAKTCKGVSFTVYFLDDTHHTFLVEKRAKGNALLDQVYQHLDLVEKNYFGLQFFDSGWPSDGNKQESLRWLDPSKQIRKQLTNCQNTLFFRVKFYVSDPSKLLEEYTRYQFYLQIRKDILEERLQLPPSTAILLASYIAQAEIGDYQPEEHDSEYLSNLILVPGQCLEMQRKITELHKLHKGQTPADAEFHFLDHAKRVDMYGVELHKAKDNTSKDIQLGVTQIGILVFQNDIKINTFSWSKIMKISFKRKQFFIQLLRESSEDYDTLLGFNMENYKSAKKLWKSCVEHHTFFRLDSPKIRKKFPLSFGSRFSYSGRTEYQTVSDVQLRGKLERKFVRSPSKTRIKHSVSLDEKIKPMITPGRPSRSYDNKVTSLGAKEPRKAWEIEDVPLSDENGVLERTIDAPFSPSIIGRNISYADDDNPSPTFDTPPYSASHSPTSQMADDEQTILLYKNKEGKYGFGLKGGTSDEPLVVCRVMADSEAAKRNLCEGDQILKINGEDVSSSYDAALRLIKSRKSDRLQLVVRKSRSRGSAEEVEEPPLRFVPLPLALESSVREIKEDLASGKLILTFDSTRRSRAEKSCDESAKTKNVGKNRYRDIAPYDSTRVVLRNATSGDYINANYVNIPVRTEGEETLVNKYIATQGPLPTTVDDFWQMVLESNSTLVVMLTTLVEKNRAKCHKYWPDINQSLSMQNCTIKCTDEDINESFIIRKFILKELKTGKERQLKHIQCTAWPDHGVPESLDMFINFTELVRESRQDDAPMVVHCSAGIGRTGVLILMETALCQMDANLPIDPIEIVNLMRDQRTMMIQNSSQFKFVCESIVEAYEKKKSQEPSP